MLKLLERAREKQVGVPALRSTDYINTIPPEREPWFPGDEEMERQVRRLIRWNAAVMVSSANRKGLEVGGHIASYASAASLYEVGYNHFFRGKDHPGGGDQLYIQGHAAPGIYARAYLMKRLTAEQLGRFRQEVQHGPGQGLSSYPHPRLMPEFWEFPTVSMGLGALNSIYQARFNRYLHNRGIKDTSQQHVWAFLGDGEMGEPESLGAIRVAAREELDNLTFVINCNLQQLDGPVTGNGKIMQELEANFRGAGWNVIKVVWGREWDALLAKDVDGVLVNQMNRTPDGDFQTYSVENGAYIREHFFGPDARLRKMVEHLTDEQIELLPRGGHDYLQPWTSTIERLCPPSGPVASTPRRPGVRELYAEPRLSDCTRRVTHRRGNACDTGGSPCVLGTDSSGCSTFALALSAIAVGLRATVSRSAPAARAARSHRGPGLVAVHVDDRVLHQGHREAHRTQGDGARRDRRLDQDRRDRVAARPGDSPQGFRFNLGDPVDMLNVFADMVNDCGGINGRDIDLTVVQQEGGAADQATTLANAQAACIKATEDNEPFIVLSGPAATPLRNASPTSTRRS